jgi:flagellar protein FliT
MLAKVMREMLAAARLQQWDRLSELETFYTMQAEQLKVQENRMDLPADVQAHKLSIIKAILADDREVRALINPWMDRLSKLMNGANMEAKLNRSYGM